VTGSRSVNIGRNVAGSVIATGDGSLVQANITAASVKETSTSGSVDIANELAQIRSLLERLHDENNSRIRRALDDADEEAQKPSPNKDEIGTALERAFKYAERSNGIADQVGKLAPHISNAVAWLGDSWHHLLSIISQRP
jgi:hypothetical protein